MKGIKLTPFLLFVILLVVLVCAMLFGSSSKGVVEGATTMEGSESSSIWSSADKGSLSSYASGSPLHIIFSDYQNNHIYYFDPLNGNVVISAGVEGTYTLLTRNGSGVPQMITADDGAGTDVATSMEMTVASWTYTGSDSISLMYCPYKTHTVVLLINNIDDRIIQIFRNASSKSETMLPLNTTTGVLNTSSDSTYSSLGNSTRQSVSINGKNVDAMKITNEVYFSDEMGISVGDASKSFSSSMDFVDSVSRQNNTEGTILVIGCRVSKEMVLIAVVIKDPTTNNYITASSNFVPFKEPDGDSNDTWSMSVELPNDKGDSDASTTTGTMPDKGGNSYNYANESCNKQYKSEPSYICPNNTDGTGNKKDNESCNNPDYIRKSEIVPPVCPGCPPCPVVSPASCGLSINSSGEIVDCTGKKYEANDLIANSSPATFEGQLGTDVGETAGALGGAVGDTAKAAGGAVEKGFEETGDVLEKGLDTAGGALDKGVDTVGNAFGKTLDTTSDIVGELGDTIGDVASGLGQGVSGLGQGASSLVQGVSSDVAGLGNNVIDSAENIVQNTGSGIMQLSQQQQQQQQQQQGFGFAQQQGMMQTPQYGYGYPTQPGYGMPAQPGYGMPAQPGYGYSYPQPCPSTSNFMPITNDFSQFT